MRDTKERIMEAAFALMIKNGVDAVSTGDITKALGLSRSLPYRYFSTKRELVYETFKLYFCDRFFPDPGAPAPSTLYDAVRLVANTSILPPTDFPRELIISESLSATSRTAS